MHLLDFYFQKKLDSQFRFQSPLYLKCNEEQWFCKMENLKCFTKFQEKNVAGAFFQ